MKIWADLFHAEDRQQTMMKLVVAFRKYVKVPKKRGGEGKIRWRYPTPWLHRTYVASGRFSNEAIIVQTKTVVIHIDSQINPKLWRQVSLFLHLKNMFFFAFTKVDISTGKSRVSIIRCRVLPVQKIFARRVVLVLC